LDPPFMTKRLVARGNALVFGVLIAIILLVGGLTWDRFSAARSARELSQHTYEVLVTLNDLGIAVRDAETGQRGYLLTGNDDYLSPYRSALGRVSFLQGELQRLTADNPLQQQRLRGLAPLLQRKLEELAQTVQLRRDVGFDAALRIVRADLGREFMKQIDATLMAMTRDEQALLTQRLAETDRRGILVRWLMIGGTALAILTLLWAARLLNQACRGPIGSRQRSANLRSSCGHRWTALARASPFSVPTCS
jgi:CHASE3 domain sensor protein